VVLASASLPLLFQAVEMDGKAHWDGGFAGNPSILPLITEGPADDVLLVQINPHPRERVPMTARDSPVHMNEVGFNTSLLKELCSIALMQQLIKAEGRPGHHYREPSFERAEALCVHRIDGRERLVALAACRTWGVESENQPQRGQFLPGLQAHSLAMGQKDGEKWGAAADLQPTTPKSDRLLGVSSKTDTRWRFLSRLHGLGREAVVHWLEIHGADLGRRSTVDLGQEFLE
jgi:hypothetical protein